MKKQKELAQKQILISNNGNCSVILKDGIITIEGKKIILK